MRTTLTIQELLSGRRKAFDEAKNIQMTCLPLNTIQGNDGVDFYPYQVASAQELLEKHGRVAFREFVSYWSANSNRQNKRAKRMIDADFIVFFIACGSKSTNEKVPAQLVAVYEVIDHTVKKDANGNYLLDIVEVADFKDLYDNKVFVDYISCQEMTHDFAKCPKSVI